MTDIDKKDGSGTLQSEDTKTAAVKFSGGNRN